MRKIFIGMFIEIVVFGIVMTSIGLLSYEMGEYDGLRNFCPKGDLIKDYDTGKISCESKNNASYVTYKGFEVNLNGD